MLVALLVCSIAGVSLVPEVPGHPVVRSLHSPSTWKRILWVVPASRVAMDTSSLLLAVGPPLTFKAPAPKLIISDEFKCG